MASKSCAITGRRTIRHIKGPDATTCGEIARPGPTMLPQARIAVDISKLRTRAHAFSKFRRGRPMVRSAAQHDTSATHGLAQSEHLAIYASQSPAQNR
eukprot:12028885-Alexandrium_andersonii.AAC.1